MEEEKIRVGSGYSHRRGMEEEEVKGTGRGEGQLTVVVGERRNRGRGGPDALPLDKFLAWCL